MTARRTLIAGGSVLAMDNAVADGPGCDVLLESERVVAVGPGLDAPDAERIQARDMIVLPGFVDTHRHTWQSCVRHRYADMDPQRYFTEMLGALETGVTTMLDWSHVQNTPEHADAAIATAPMTVSIGIPPLG